MDQDSGGSVPSHEKWCADLRFDQCCPRGVQIGISELGSSRADLSEVRRVQKRSSACDGCSGEVEVFMGRTMRMMNIP